MQPYSAPDSMKHSSTSKFSVKRRTWALHDPKNGFLSYLENGLILWTRDPALALTWLNPQQAASRLKSCEQLRDVLPAASLQQLTLTTNRYPFLWRNDTKSVSTAPA